MLLLVLAPSLMPVQPVPLLLAYLALPAYMIHQVEEHDADRFRRHVNALLGPDRAGLSLGDVAAINLGGVWLPLALVLWLAQTAGSGWAAVSGWLLLVNGLAHAGPAIVLHRRNPGLLTALLLFVPLGSALVLTAGASPLQHLVGLAAAIILHAAIVARARRPAKAQA